MSPKLTGYSVLVAMLLVGGVSYELWTPQPSDRTMADLRDAGIGDGQGVVVVGLEKLDAKAKRRIRNQQPGVLRPRQSVGIVARVGRCFSFDGGNCLNAAGETVRPGQINTPSRRTDLVPVWSEDAGEGDGGEDDTDSSRQLKPDSFEVLRCNTFDAGDPSPFATPFCNQLNRMMLLPSRCVVPNCWNLPDGGWNDESPPVDCKMRNWEGIYRWAGCNVIPTGDSSGTDCLPAECTLEPGDKPEWLE